MEPKANLTRSDIFEAITTLRDQYLVEEGLSSYKEINDGLCENFASDVVEYLATKLSQGVSIYDHAEELEFTNFSGLSGEENDQTFYEDTLRKFNIPLPEGVSIGDLNNAFLVGHGNHFFVEVQHGDGKRWFYDAECPEGVNSPFCLPLGMELIANKGFLAPDR